MTTPHTENIIGTWCIWEPRGAASKSCHTHPKKPSTRETRVNSVAQRTRARAYVRTHAHTFAHTNSSTPRTHVRAHTHTQTSYARARAHTRTQTTSHTRTHKLRTRAHTHTHTKQQHTPASHGPTDPLLRRQSYRHHPSSWHSHPVRGCFGSHVHKATSMTAEDPSRRTCTLPCSCLLYTSDAADD